jgi:predicted nucleic acid-binding protein
MDYLIDTCVFSEFTKPRPAASVDRWIAAVAETSQFVSVLSLGELEKGVRKLATSRRRNDLERWLTSLRARLQERTLGVDADIALEWGRISAQAEGRGRPLPVVDALLGATAIVHGLAVATRNSSDIERTGARIVDPWVTTAPAG